MTAEYCFRQMMENVLVQASSLANLDFGSMIGFGGGGVAASDFAAAGSVSAADMAYAIDRIEPESLPVHVHVNTPRGGRSS